MSDHAHDHGHGEEHGGHADEHHEHPNYVKIWAILLGLLAVSVLGPMVGIKAVTLMTAFGIAVVKAYLVAKNFMHIDIAPRFVTYLVTTMLVFMLLFFAGTAPDVMNVQGTGWQKPAWIEANKQEAEFRQHGGGAHGAAAEHGGGGAAAHH
jgi:caa(3)-type oxidase subunit IV